MPVVSEFRGIRITINYEYDEKHSTPHFHARYGSDEASFSIVTLEILACTRNFPARIAAEIRKWAMMHRRQLKKNWYRTRFSRPIIKIQEERHGIEARDGS
jgi:hypothetical protein